VGIFHPRIEYQNYLYIYIFILQLLFINIVTALLFIVPLFLLTN